MQCRDNRSQEAQVRSHPCHTKNEVNIIDIKLIRTDTTLDLSPKAEKVCEGGAAVELLSRLWEPKIEFKKKPMRPRFRFNSVYDSGSCRSLIERQDPKSVHVKIGLSTIITSLHGNLSYKAKD